MHGVAAANSREPQRPDKLPRFNDITRRKMARGLHFVPFMQDHAQLPATRKFCVEVSGWDRSERFFVENCDLLWSEETGKHVVLAHKLRDKAVLFVRLLQSSALEQSRPVVHEAVFMGKAESGGNRFRLQTVTPRMAEFEAIAK